MPSPIVRFAIFADPQYSDHEPSIGRDYRRGRLHTESLIRQFNNDASLDFVFNLGDIVDGRTYGELPLMLDLLSSCKIPVKHTVGNHDTHFHSRNELQKLFKINNLFYDFAVSKVRFIILDSMDVSVAAPETSPERQAAEEFLKANASWHPQTYNGMLSQPSYTWLKDKLAAAENAGEDIIILTHIPVLEAASHKSCLLWDAPEMLKVIDNAPHLRAWFAGHHHGGGCAVRNHVLHKTFKGNCETPLPTAAIVSIYADRIVIDPIGNETGCTHFYEP